MCKGVDSPNITDDMIWLAGSTRNNTIGWCTDSCQGKDCAPRVSSAGWMTYYTEFDNRTIEKLFGILNDTESHRGEQSGLCTIHHLIAALYLFHNISTWHTTVNCNNQGTINTPERHLRSILLGPSCADLENTIRPTQKVCTCSQCTSSLEVQGDSKDW